ncbi:MAG: nitronate monooxygenase [Syntrophales bacterium]|jgi:nitronate monooxygenase|nr:nitronate monooxygenase [Syntrophales bacterium]
MFDTAITQMFGVKYPVVCGAMMWLCKPKFCAAISNAGGMGNLTAGNYSTAEEFRSAIHTTRKLTDKPFMVNITFVPSFREYYRLPSLRVTTVQHDEFIRVCIEEQVAGIEFSGMPLDIASGMKTVEMLKKANVRIFHKVGSVRHALHAQKVGYDGVYAVGFEGGGHPQKDDVTTMLLTPRVVDTVDLPVITAGGIADGRSMAAAMVLGAQGVMMATRFIATRECEVHDNIKHELLRRGESETTIFGRTVGFQGRALRCKLIQDILDVEERDGGLRELIPLLSGQKIKQAWDGGDVDRAPLMIGQSVGLIEDIPSCRELLDRMVGKAAHCVERFGSMIQA